MDQLVACPDCGTPNRADADLCVQCWHALTDDVLSKIPAAAFAVAAAAPAARVVPSPPAAPALRKPVPAPKPVVAEARPVEAAPGPVPYFALASPASRPSETAVVSDWAPPLQRKPYPWKFRHLWLVGAAAWGLPYFATWTLIKGKTGRAFVDAALAVEVAAYAIALLAIVCLVHLVQRGDWNSVGLKRTERTPLDFAAGAALGLVLIASFLGGLYLVYGSFEPDFVTRFLLGGTTGAGAILGAVVLVVGAPVIEEVYFRGMLFERFARWGVATAVIGTSVLFVLAHGVGIWDPPRLLLGFALGFARRSKSLWFTIAGHAAWNGAIVFIALFMMTGSGHDFTSSDASFSLRHPARWERMEQAEGQSPAGNVELVLTSPSGSFLAVGTFPVPPDVNRYTLTKVVQQAQGALPLPPGIKMGRFEETHNVPGPTVTSYEAEMRISDPMLGEGRARMVFALNEGSTSLVMVVMACPATECGKAETDFDAMLKSVQFSA